MIAETSWVHNMEHKLEVGLQLQEDYVIKREHASKSVGSGEVEVLSTPSMIAFIEQTSRRCVQPKLPIEHTTVGIRVDVRHLKPVPIGEKLSVTTTLIEINNRKLTFEVKAEWQNKTIGVGRHERFIVNKKKFLQKIMD